MAKKQKPEAEVPVQTEPTVLEPVKPKRRPAKTLGDVFDGYIAALEERGNSSGTIASYRMELDLAAKALGAETPVSALTDTAVAAFFESDPVTRKRNGKANTLFVAMSRRTLHPRG